MKSPHKKLVILRVSSRTRELLTEAAHQEHRSRNEQLLHLLLTKQEFHWGFASHEAA
jgi:uncharacterized protein (DUF1778 family)